MTTRLKVRTLCAIISSLAASAQNKLLYNVRGMVEVLYYAFLSDFFRVSLVGLNKGTCCTAFVKYFSLCGVLLLKDWYIYCNWPAWFGRCAF